jgi:hypothetical protein
MTKSEKSVLEDIAGMLNAILTGNSDGDQPTNETAEEATQVDDVPSQEQIDFVRELANDGEIAIRGCIINLTKGTVGEIGISKDCLSRLLEAYLEKYDHE